MTIDVTKALQEVFSLNEANNSKKLEHIEKNPDQFT